ncbi:MAG: sigma-70 family RNA polymerase sigma factor [Ruminococcus sp.]|nr:sigma-70 family RNA polymerase sigma factor [Ruminococcus sp.]
MSDGELLELLFTDSERAVSELKRIYGGYVYAIVRDKLSAFCKEDTEETVSDVFVSLWRRREKIDLQRGSLKAYICVLAKSIALRKREQLSRTDGQVSLDEIGGTLYDESYKQGFDRAELKEQLLRLKKEDRKLIICRYYYGLHFKEIAALLDIGEAAARKRTERILKKLKEESL